MLIALGVTAALWVVCGALAWFIGGTQYVTLSGVRYSVLRVSRKQRVKYALWGPIGMFQAGRSKREVHRWVEA